MKTHKTDDPKPVSVRRRNRRQWCRGKVGVAHKPVCRAYDDVKQHGKPLTVGTLEVHGSRDWKLLVCEACGKELDRWFPMRKSTATPPDWVK